jgi:hypothetical protein
MSLTIGGQGPFLFALDTGASNTVVDVQVTDQVGLVRLVNSVRSARIGRAERVRLRGGRLRPAPGAAAGMRTDDCTTTTG